MCLFPGFHRKPNGFTLEWAGLSALCKLLCVLDSDQAKPTWNNRFQWCRKLLRLPGRLDLGLPPFLFGSIVQSLEHMCSYPLCVCPMSFLTQHPNLDTTDFSWEVTCGTWLPYPSCCRCLCVFFAVIHPSLKSSRPARWLAFILPLHWMRWWFSLAALASPFFCWLSFRLAWCPDCSMEAGWFFFDRARAGSFNYSIWSQNQSSLQSAIWYAAGPDPYLSILTPSQEQA